MKIESGLINFYGEVALEKRNDQWYLTLEDHDETQAVQVSKAFALAFQQEFGTRKISQPLQMFEESRINPEDALWKDFLKEVR